MFETFRAWLSQVTTGHGVMVLAPTLAALATGEMSLHIALPLLIAGIIGIIWPENAKLKSATQATITDLEQLVAAYRSGAAAPPAPASAGAADTAKAVAPVILGIAAAGLLLAACTGQTEQQRLAGIQAAASGLVCVADGAGKVIAAAATDDPDAVKTANAALVAGGTLLTDKACQDAMAKAAAAVPQAQHDTPPAVLPAQQLP